MSAIVVSKVSFSGGTGKSNFVANTSYLVANCGLKVAVVDADVCAPGLNFLFGIDNEQIKPRSTVGEAVLGKCEIADVGIDLTQKLNIRNGGELVLFPSSMNLSVISQLNISKHPDNQLAKTLNSIATNFDFDMVFIDTTPGQSRETLLVLSISHLAIVALRPVQRDLKGTEAMLLMAKELGLDGKKNKIALAVNAISPTFNITQVQNEISSHFGLPVVMAIADTDEMRILRSSDLVVRAYPKVEVSRQLHKLANYVVSYYEER